MAVATIPPDRVSMDGERPMDTTTTNCIDVLDPFQPPARDPNSMPSSSKGKHPTQPMGNPIEV